MIARPSLSLVLSPLLTGLVVGVVNKGFDVLLRIATDRLFLKYQEDLPFFPALDGFNWRQRQLTQINPAPEDLLMRERPFIQEVIKDTFTVRVWQNAITTVTAIALSILLMPETAKSSRAHQATYALFTACTSVLAIFCTTDLSLSKLVRS
ncbi:MAG: hypothetical protein IT584_01830 [Chlamydiae bacterium]|nr:hypothetical protein [Chlamydiota bacterium]